MTRALVPQFRERKAGIIVNVTSSTTQKSLPMLSVYTASKAAINAFTECLAMELEPFNVRVSLVIPGRAPETAFSKNARSRMIDGIPEAHASFAQKVFAAMGQSSEVTRPFDVAEAVWNAVTDPLSPLRIPAGADAVALEKSR